MTDRLEILPVRGIGEIVEGTDLARVIIEAAPWLRDGDILVVTSKIVAKAEGRVVDVPSGGPEREAAREEILQAETVRTVARRGHVRIVQTHHGFVMASAGVDASNVDRSRLVLLPKDPDASARALRAAIGERFGRTVAVIVSDTMGRAWRNGLTDVALGAAGIAPIRDYRGERDPYGNELLITQVATIDELCAAADLVKGKCDQIPVAVIRGYPKHWQGSGGADADGPGAAALVRAPEHDLFPLGTAEAHAGGLRAAAELTDVAGFAPSAADPAQLRHIVAAVPTGPGTVVAFVDPPSIAKSVEFLPPQTSHLLRWTLSGDPADTRLWLRLGEDLHRLRCALAAVGFATCWRPAAEAAEWMIEAGAATASHAYAGVLAIGPAPDGGISPDQR